MKRKDLRAAKERGLISRRVASTIRARERRTCVTCGKAFLDDEWSTRIFGCGCCAYAYGNPSDADRNLGVGDRVLVLKSGKAGTLDRFARSGDEVLGVVVLDGGGYAYVRPGDVEKVMGVEVKHQDRCVHGSKMPESFRRRAEKGGAEDEDDGQQDWAGDGDAVQGDEAVL